MKHIELPAVGYGDCTVLMGSGSLLMVDCGSMNNKLRNPEMEMTGVFSFLKERYSVIRDRRFLLTHYHRDHLCGFQNIFAEDSSYFSAYCLPFLPYDAEGVNPLLQLSLFAYALSSPQSDISQVNTACVTLPLKIWESAGENRLRFLKAGDCFSFDGEEYEVLNPPAVSTFPEVLYGSLAKLRESHPDTAAIADEFCRLYQIFQESPDSSLCSELKELKDKLRDIRRSGHGDPLFAEQDFLRTFSAAVNNESVVFHNKHSGSENIIMTGDISCGRFEEIFPGLHRKYHILKAPHHGTAGGYSSIFTELEPAHILIQNDEYRPDLRIHWAYSELESIRHCSGNLACEYFKEYGSCCNRLSRCSSFGKVPELALKCPDIRSRSHLPGCRIYVLAPAGGRSCFCD